MPVAAIELTGELVDTASEAWRHDCELRYVLAMPSREARQAYFSDLASKFKQPERAKRVEADALALYWKRAREYQEKRKAARDGAEVGDRTRV